jgi:hypothetical protein
VPTARELARNDAARALIALTELPYTLSRPFAAPPGLPPERAAALQRAFLAVHGDAQYLEEAARLRIDVSPIGGDGVLGDRPTPARRRSCCTTSASSWPRPGRRAVPARKRQEKAMKRSSERILTTHVGSPPRPPICWRWSRPKSRQARRRRRTPRACAPRGRVVRADRPQIDASRRRKLGKPSFVTNERLGG